MNTVLLIEDDANLAAGISELLSANAFVVKWLSSLRLAKNEKPQNFDLILLDWALGDGQGIDLLRDWRRDGVQAPIIMISAKSQLSDKVLGLEIGADDYLAKPFEPAELVARMRARLRAVAVASPQDEISDSGIWLSQTQRKATFNGGSVDLTRLEFNLLAKLMLAKGQVFGREELLDSVWGFEAFPTTRTIDTHILQLRHKFGADYFETVRGIGYRFVGHKVDKEFARA